MYPVLGKTLRPWLQSIVMICMWDELTDKLRTSLMMISSRELASAKLASARFPSSPPSSSSLFLPLPLLFPSTNMTVSASDSTKKERFSLKRSDIWW